MRPEKKTQAGEAASDKDVMGAISSPINTIANASAASPYSSPHSPTQAPPRATPQDVAVLSAHAVHFGETTALPGYSFSTTPSSAASAAPSVASSTTIRAASRNGETAPQPQSAQPTPDPIRAIYSNQTKAPPVFSVLA